LTLSVTNERRRVLQLSSIFVVASFLLNLTVTPALVRLSGWFVWPYAAVHAMPDPLGRGGQPSNIPGGICWLLLVVLVERTGGSIFISPLHA
jgi:hypothetical protein